jgi:uncharacterized protein (TIGR02646 family)
VIKVSRTAEPDGLAAARMDRVKTLSPDAAPVDGEARLAHGYQRVKAHLHEMQHMKCCYCEQIHVPIHNDVEHYRPRSKYWWLAWTWDNLLFACRACNGKGGKEDDFPLLPGSVPLGFGESAPGLELPELLDPSVDEPRDHIRFERDPNGKWAPVGASWRGAITLHIVGITRDEYRELYNRHVEKTVQPVVDDLHEAQRTRPRSEFEAFWRRKCTELLDPARQFRALSEDVLRYEFPSYPAPPP